MSLRLKAFLSHSSKDKFIVEEIAKNLPGNLCVYDKFSFEEGKLSINEITTNLDKSGIFVFFISQHSLNSEWVKKEILLAETPLKKSEIIIFPIIIDMSVKYDDPRLPKWLSAEYNIQYIGKRAKIISLIKQEIIKLKWKFLPHLEKEENFFVGRNFIINELEKNYYHINPPCFFISGVRGNGRRSILKYLLSKKVELFEPSYQISTISLDYTQGFHDLILGISDLGFNSKTIHYEDIVNADLAQNISLCKQLLEELSQEKIFIFIEDDGCIVNKNRSISEPFITAILTAQTMQPTIGIISKYRPLSVNILELQKKISFTDVPELNHDEIDMFVRKLSAIFQLQLEEEDISFLEDVLNGHPQQIKYALELIKLEGIYNVKKNPHEIIDFNIRNLSPEINDLLLDEGYKEILVLLARFEYIEIGILYEILEDDPSAESRVAEIINLPICEFLGTRKEYVRLNRAIKDIIDRSGIKIAEKFRKKLELHMNNFLKTYKIEDKDLSDYLYSIREAIINNKIDISHVLPSHILKTIITLYDKDNYDLVIELGERTLLKKLNIEYSLVNQIRKYLCLSYIRSGSDYTDKFMKEVHLLESSVDINFLLGFYYRINDQNDKALERFKSCLSEYSKHIPAKRELVHVLMSLEHYDSALELARENYYSQKENIFFFQSYALCLFESTSTKQEDKLLELKKIISDFSIYAKLSPKSEEIHSIVKAHYLALIENFDDAVLEINSCIARFSNAIYPRFAKINICYKANMLPEMKTALDSINIKGLSKTNVKTLKKFQIKYFEKKGDTFNAERILNNL